jgi:peptidoglycan hydrolase-like protein with peptidoglycan-binding domain
LLAIVAVVFLGLGFLLGGLVRSPAELAAETAVPPEGLITAKVEARAITSTVTARADVVFADPVEINPAAPEGVGAPVVTGQVPEVGAEVKAGDVILEVSGSPVFVLPGSFKAYRSMGPGSSGPDVAQLRAALAALGYNAGNAESKDYDKALADAVKALYQDAGYPAPGSENLELARAARDAGDAVVDAREARDQAARAVTAAEKAVEEAPDAAAQAQAVEALEAARSALAQAERSVARAREALADAEKAAWTTMPLGAVVFVADLPRRVDQVSVAVGSDLGEVGGGEPDPMAGQPASSAAVVLSGAEIEVTAQVASDEAALLKVGGEAQLAVGGGEVTGQIAEICPEAAAGAATDGGAAGEVGAGAGCAVKITVADLGEAAPEELTGNVLVTMVVGVSSEDSLVVPVAAVSADTAGNARIEVVVGELAKDQAAADQETRVVGIVPGLTAEGMVEVKEADIELKAGDLVVVGRAGSLTAESPAAVDDAVGRS